MTKKYPNDPATCWEFMAQAREALTSLYGGRSAMVQLQRIFGNRSAAQLYRWCRQPGEETDWQPGPLAWLAELFALLEREGRTDLALMGLRILAEPVGARVELAEGGTLTGSMGEGALELFARLHAVLSAAKENRDVIDVDQRIEECVSDLRRFGRCYREKMERCGSVRFRSGDSGRSESLLAQGFWEKQKAKKSLLSWLVRGRHE